MAPCARVKRKGQRRLGLRRAGPARAQPSARQHTVPSLSCAPLGHLQRGGVPPQLSFLDGVG